MISELHRVVCMTSNFVEEVATSSHRKSLRATTRATLVTPASPPLSSRSYRVAMPMPLLYAANRKSDAFSGATPATKCIDKHLLQSRRFTYPFGETLAGVCLYPSHYDRSRSECSRESNLRRFGPVSLSYQSVHESCLHLRQPG
jgi:hypothetical protein